MFLKDYGAPLTEWGDYTPKYDMIAKLVAKHNMYRLRTPPRPDHIQPIKYGSIKITHHMDLTQIIETVM